MKKILILSANPLDTSKLRLDEEVREIRAALKRAKNRDKFQIITESAVRADDLRLALLEHEPSIVHFSGHGSGKDGLAFESNSGHLQLVSTESLVRLFELFKTKIECVLLNACYSKMQADAIHEHIDCVIGMSRAIGDRAAIEFAVGFYDALGAGYSYDYCFKIACVSVNLEGIPESETPVLRARPRSYPDGEDIAVAVEEKTPQSTLNGASLYGGVEIAQRNNKQRNMSLTEYRNRQTLLNKVNNYWVKGVLENSLHNQIKIELGLEEKFDALVRPWDMELESGGQRTKAVPHGTKVINLFDRIGEGRSLLILGEPGSGKTITLLELACELIKRAKIDVNQLIPVVFNLSSWALKRQKMENWLVDELNNKYQIPKSIGQSWVEEQQLLLLLDGLDEVRLKYRDDCVAALNAFGLKYAPEMVVACRIKDYEALPNRLQLQSAIYLRPLVREQIRDYFKNVGSDFTSLNALIERDSALQELASSPLILSIMTVAYQGVSLENLPKTEGLEEHRSLLFNSYIERMLKRRGNNPRYKYENRQVIYWLILLAQRMVEKSQTIFLIEQMQPSLLDSKIDHKKYLIGVKLIIGLLLGIYAGLLFKILNYEADISLIDNLFSLFRQSIAGLISGLVSALIVKCEYGLGLGILSGVILGLITIPFSDGELPFLEMMIFGVFFGVVFKIVNINNIRAVDTIEWSWIEVQKKFTLGSVSAVIVGMVLLLNGRTWLYKLLTNEDTLSPWLVNFLCKTIIPIINDYSHTIYCRTEIPTLGSLPLNIFLGLASLSLSVGLWVGVILGFKKGTDIEGSVIPNQGILRSQANAIKLLAISGTLAGFISLIVWSLYKLNPSIFWWIYYGKTSEYSWRFALVIGSMVGLSSGLVGGDNSGLVCIQHFILRLLLWSKGYIPWNYARFLNYATTQIVLQKVGGGYIFIHRLLLEHFASMSPNYPKMRTVVKDEKLV
jgi:eukaryotic-like serine/threonine-protein kinase